MDSGPAQESWPGGLPSTLVELLRRRASEQPDRVAFTFLPDGETEAGSLTHGTLDTRARAIGALLSADFPPCSRAILLCPSGLDFVAGFFGCLYASMTAVPAYPLDPSRMDRTVARLETIIEDCQPAVALTDGHSLRTMEPLLKDHPILARLRWIAIETVPEQLAGSWQSPTEEPEALAVIQYTSGSTRAPRGVMLSHRNILANRDAARFTYGYSHLNTFVGWVPLAHDLGLFSHVVHPLYVGALSVLMPPEAFIQKPSVWMKAAGRYPNVATHAPNFAWELVARRITPEELKGLDLSSLHTASFGGEPIRPETLDRFAATFACCGFRRERFVAGYGLAEATLLVSSTRNPRVLRVNGSALGRDRVLAEPDTGEPDGGSRRLVSVGPAAPGRTVVVVDPSSAVECGPGQVGEIWVSAANVGRGYWNKAADTELTFRAFTKDTHRGPFLRTGDLGFLDNGELFVTGRLKDLIILHGRNYYPQDFELTVETVDKAFRRGCTAAFAIDNGAEERLVVVQELRDTNQAGLPAIVSKVKSAVFHEHGVTPHDVVFVPPGGIPKTSSGKVRRQDCRALYLSSALPSIPRSLDQVQIADPVVPPRTSAEKALAAIWSQALNLPISAIGIHESFLDLGGDSLAAVNCLAQIHAAFGLADLQPEIFLYAPTLARMAEELTAARSAGARGTEILTIRQGGDGVPLVLVAPGLECQGLAKPIDQKHPVLAVLGADLRNRAQPQSLVEIAAEYAKVLRSFHPRGPYALCGFCANGVVALEMARCLENAGEQVVFVALFDARGVILHPMPRRRRLLVRSWRFAQKLVFLARTVVREGAQPLGRAVTRRARRIGEAAAPISHVDILNEALRGWSPLPWSGRILHIWATDRPRGRFRDLEFEWGDLSPNAAFFEVPGNHESMLHEPNVSAVARILAAEL